MWRYHNPVHVRFRWGALEALSSVLGNREAVLVTFPQAQDTGLLYTLRACIGDRLRDVISDVEPNPEVQWFRERYAKFHKHHRGHAIVAVGGGSVMDTAKLLQVAGDHGTFDEILEPLARGAQPHAPHVSPLIAVPTTAGTGSEVTPWATLWDRSANAKYSLHKAWPESALVDPQLTVSLGAEVTRNSGLDALSHSLESIWNVNHNPVSDALAVEAARGVIEALPRLLDKPDDAMLRSAMSRAALLAGLAFSNTRTALAHSISYEMTLRHGLPHGLACSFTLPFVWRSAAGCDAGRDEILSRIFPGEADPPARLERFLHDVGVKTRFEDYGVGRAEADAMIAHALDGARGRNFIGRRVAEVA